jgi:hypothetical protein
MLIVVALLLFLTGVAHSYLGERYILIRLFRRGNLPELMGGAEFTAGTLRFVWHLLTVVWWGVAVIVVQASGQPLDSRLVFNVFGAVALISGLFPLYFTRGKHLSWVVFFAVGAMLLLAAGSG